MFGNRFCASVVFKMENTTQLYDWTEEENDTSEVA